jgi:hypothetical protein
VFLLSLAWNRAGRYTRVFPKLEFFFIQNRRPGGDPRVMSLWGVDRSGKAMGSLHLGARITK